MSSEKKYYYAFRNSNTLEGPAIFSHLRDCRLHVDGEKVEYKRFASAHEALTYAFDEKERLQDGSISTHKLASSSASPAPLAAKKPPEAKVVTDDGELEATPRMVAVVAAALPRRGTNAAKTQRLRPLQDLYSEAEQQQQPVNKKLKGVAFTPILPRTGNDETITATTVDLSNEGSKEQTMKRKTRHDVNFDQKFEELKQYQERYGDLNVAKRKEEYPALENWLQRQRHMIRIFEKKKNDNNDDSDKAAAADPKTAERVKRLLDVGLEYQMQKTIKLLPKSWEESFADLKAFKEEHGHTNVPSQPKSTLRNWVVLQRVKYERLKEGKKSDLNGDRVAALLKLGFDLCTNQKKPFDERALEWFEFKTKNRRDPSRDEDTEQSLSSWVCKIRAKKLALDEGRRTNLTQEQVEKLDAWGFRWETGLKKPKVTTRKDWEERYVELCRYKADHGHVNVPQLYPELGNWVHRQRKEYRCRKLGKKHRLKDKQIEKLEDVGFVWLTRSSRRPPGGNKDKPNITPERLHSEEQADSEEEEESSCDDGYDQISHSHQYDDFNLTSHDRTSSSPRAASRQSSYVYPHAVRKQPGYAGYRI